MRIGIPKEIEMKEFRVALILSVDALVTKYLIASAFDTVAANGR